MPKDTIQGAALATLMKEDGCTKVADRPTTRRSTAPASRANIELAAKEQGLTVDANEAIDKNAPNYRSLASKAKAAGADCFVYSGITANNAVQLYKDFAAALPDAKLYGPDGVAEPASSTRRRAASPPTSAAQVKVHRRDAAAGRVPAGGPGVLQGLHARSTATSNPDPYAIYGYEAMSLALDAIKRSKTGEKADVIEGALRHQGSRRACSARTRSTRTATRR